MSSIMRAVAVAAVAGIAAACATAPFRLAPEPEPVTSLAGTWLLTTESSVGSHADQALFIQNGERLSGKVTGEHGEVPVAGVVQGESVTFGMSLNVLGQHLHVNYVGTVNGDTMSGTVKFGAFGSGRWTGTRK